MICATEHEKSLLRAALRRRPRAQVSVIPLGVDLDRFRPMDKEDARARARPRRRERIILFVGRIEPLKGVDILINAAAMLESDVECSVLIVGGDESSKAQVAELRDLARDRGIEHRVAFVGAVDHDKLPLYYNAADVCVVPSHYESFGLVAVEAMASGVPVVASRVGGLTGTVKDGETGYLIPWLCPEPFAERIELLLDNEPLRRNLGEAAREVVGRYRWENVAGARAGRLLFADWPPELSRRPVARRQPWPSTSHRCSGETAAPRPAANGRRRRKLPPLGRRPQDPDGDHGPPGRHRLRLRGQRSRSGAPRAGPSTTCSPPAATRARTTGLTRQELAAMREEEQREAAARPRRQRRLLPRLPGRLPADDNTELRGQIVRLLRNYKPDVVLTWDGFRTGFNHNDHRNIGIAVRDAVYPAVRDHLYYAEHADGGPGRGTRSTRCCWRARTTPTTSSTSATSSRRK